jgi:cob(I)alamin adenosyltransferase
MTKALTFKQVTTRGGDEGESTLFDGERRSKTDAVFETLGDLDEFTSWLGVVRARRRGEWVGPLRDLDDELYDVQTVLSRIAALVACSPGTQQYARLTMVDDSTVAELELREARLLEVTRIEPVFIVPGTTEAAAELDFARTICRRCERRLVALIRSQAHPRPDLHAAQHYLNRLSDYLFIAGRSAEQTDER